MRHQTTLFLAATAFAVGLWVLPVIGQEHQVASGGLETMWAAPITLEVVPPPEVGKPSVFPRENGISLGQSVDRDGRIMFLARRSDFSSSANVLLEDFERNGFRTPIQLRLNGTRADNPPTLLARIFGTGESAYSRIPSIGSLALDNQNRVWVGGATDYHVGIGSDQHSRAYLARLDDMGTPIWEKSYETGNVPFVVSITPASDGNALVAAVDGWFRPSWLAMISGADGTIVWKRSIGNGSGIAVGSAGKDAFLVASFDTTRTDGAYEEGVAVRKVTADGTVGPSTLVRPGINTQESAHYGGLSISSTNDGAYVVSTWQDPFRFKAAEIDRVDKEGRLLWRATIPVSFFADTNRSGVTPCGQPAVATLPDGDALVACASRGTIHTHTFSQLTGYYSHDSFPAPKCNNGHQWISLSLFVRPDGRVLLSGTRPGGNVGPGCSWLAHLPSPGR